MWSQKTLWWNILQFIALHHHQTLCLTNILTIVATIHISIAGAGNGWKVKQLLFKRLTLADQGTPLYCKPAWSYWPDTVYIVSLLAFSDRCLLTLYCENVPQCGNHTILFQWHCCIACWLLLPGKCIVKHPPLLGFSDQDCTALCWKHVLQPPFGDYPVLFDLQAFFGFGGDLNCRRHCTS